MGKFEHRIGIGWWGEVSVCLFVVVERVEYGVLNEQTMAQCTENGLYWDEYTVQSDPRSSD